METPKPSFLEEIKKRAAVMKATSAAKKLQETMKKTGSKLVPGSLMGGRQKRSHKRKTHRRRR